MKHLMIIAILASFSMSAFAVGQTTTECPMMREANKRMALNLKLEALKDVKKKEVLSNGIVIQ
jgi:hypothetical protein